METLGTIRLPGAGRSTDAALHLADIWHQKGERVLLVDLDPLGRASRSLGLERALPGTAADVLFGRRSLAAATHVLADGLDLVPASRLLAAFEAFAARDVLVAKRFGLALAGVAHRYDRALLFTPPEGGAALFTTALSVADAALLFVEPASFGFREVEGCVRRIRAAADGRPLPLWMAALGLSERSPLSRNFLVGLRARFGRHVLRTVVPDGGGRPSRAGHEPLDALADELHHELSRRLPESLAVGARRRDRVVRSEVPVLSAWTP